MNHKYSSYALLLLILFLVGGSVLSKLVSSEVDDICDKNNNILFRYNGTWGCGNFLDSKVFNFTINNITNIYNNYSMYSNQTSFLVPNTNVDISSWNITANSFIGDGSQLTGISGGIWTNDSGTAQYIGNVNITGNTTVGNKVGIGTMPSYLLHIMSSSLSETYAQYIDVTHNQTGIKAPLGFIVTIPSTGTAGSGAIVIDGIVKDQTASQSHSLYGIRMSVNPNAVTQTAGTKIYRGIDITNNIATFGSGGSTSLTGLYYTGSSAVQITGNQVVDDYGIYLDGTPPNKVGGTGSVNQYGLYIKDYTGGLGLTNQYAIFVNDGKTRLQGNLNVTTGGIQANDYYSGDGSQGLTVQLNMTGCNITVKDGLITGYSGC